MKYTRILLVTVMTLVGMSITASAQVGLGGVVRSTTGAAGNAGQRSGSVSGSTNSQGSAGQAVGGQQPGQSSYIFAQYSYTSITQSISFVG